MTHSYRKYLVKDRCLSNCPDGSFRLRGSCDCVCYADNTLWNATTNHCECVATLNCSVSREYNKTTCQCEDGCLSNCPKGSFRHGDSCECVCDAENTLWNATTNHCECVATLNCGVFREYDKTTCQCEDNCPFKCPPSSQRKMHSCDCICNIYNAQWNATTNHCDCIKTLKCGRFREFNETSCICDDTCSFRCPQKSVRRRNSCACSCSLPKFYWNPTTKLCDTCLSFCPRESKRDRKTCDCICEDPNTYWNVTTNLCDKCPSNCPRGSKPQRSCGCICDDPNTYWNATTNHCECNIVYLDCHPNEAYNYNTCQCEDTCPSQCPSGTFRHTSNCNCICTDFNSVWNATTNHCDKCPSYCPKRSVRSTSSCDCICTDFNTYWNATTNHCECVATLNCSFPKRYNDATCQCEGTKGCEQRRRNCVMLFRNFRMISEAIPFDDDFKELCHSTQMYDCLNDDLSPSISTLEYTSWRLDLSLASYICNKRDDIEESPCGRFGKERLHTQYQIKRHCNPDSVVREIFRPFPNHICNSTNTAGHVFSCMWHYIGQNCFLNYLSLYAAAHNDQVRPGHGICYSLEDLTDELYRRMTSNPVIE